MKTTIFFFVYLAGLQKHLKSILKAWLVPELETLENIKRHFCKWTSWLWSDFNLHLKSIYWIENWRQLDFLKTATKVKQLLWSCFCHWRLHNYWLGSTRRVLRERTKREIVKDTGSKAPLKTLTLKVKVFRLIKYWINCHLN